MQTVNCCTMSSTNPTSTVTAAANPDVNKTTNTGHAGSSALVALPARPPRNEGLSRAISTGSAKIFSTFDSVSQLLKSTDSTRELFRSGSDLPPLLGSISVTAKEESKSRQNEDPTLEAEVPNNSEGKRTSAAPKLDSFVANLSQDSELRNILQSETRAMESREKGRSERTSETTTETSSRSKRSFNGPSIGKTTERSGMFTSREWGKNLGPLQDVDVQKVFQTSQESLTAKSDAPRKGETESSVNQPKTKRDWNDIVMRDLQASIAKPEQRSVRGGATPADAALLAAAAAAFGNPDRVGDASEKVFKEKRVLEKAEKPSKPLKKRMNQVPSALPMEVQPPMEPIEQLPPEDSNGRVFVEPTDLDVLLGRGGRTNNHPGNKKYLEAKDNMQDKYLKADKNGKTPISQELVDIVKGWRGRFLKLDPSSNRWYEVDNATARKKCSQTLREINTAEERAAKRAKYTKSSYV
ncbi:hypothetical protein ACA910_018090 [Epithemia clementina (nom. ined.)]